MLKWLYQIRRDINHLSTNVSSLYFYCLHNIHPIFLQRCSVISWILSRTGRPILVVWTKPEINIFLIHRCDIFPPWYYNFPLGALFSIDYYPLTNCLLLLEIWRYQQVNWSREHLNSANLFWCCSRGDNISVSLFVMKLLSSLIQIPLRILLANMKKSLWSFGGRSLNNLH